MSKDSEWRRSWLWVLAACAGFALTALEPSVVVPDDTPAQLVNAHALGELPRDRAEALDWLADVTADASTEEVEAEEVEAEEVEVPSSFNDLIDRALAERGLATPPSPPSTVLAPLPTTTTAPPSPAPSVPVVTTTAPDPPTTVPPATTVPDPSTTTAAEQRFVELINQERAAEGLSALEVDVEIRAVARDWTEEMIDAGRSCGGGLRHNPSYTEEMPTGWTRVAENVGCGPSVAAIHNAFMDSPGHRGHILDEGLTHVGVGVGIADDGTMWVTQNFGQY